MTKARVWWNGEQWESYVPGDEYSFVDPSWRSAVNWAILGSAVAQTRSLLKAE